jgi:hypothetical protein
MSVGFLNFVSASNPDPITPAPRLMRRPLGRHAVDLFVCRWRLEGEERMPVSLSYQSARCAFFGALDRLLSS